MATSLPPPGASRPRPPLSPPQVETAPRADGTGAWPSPGSAGANGDEHAAEGWTRDDVASSPAVGRTATPPPPPPPPPPPTDAEPAAIAVTPLRRLRLPSEDDADPHAAGSPPSALLALDDTAVDEPDAGVAVDDADAARRRSNFQRLIVFFGFGLIAFAIGQVAYTSWVLGQSGSWTWWTYVALLPAIVAALAAVFGLPHLAQISLVAAVWYVLLAIAVLVLAPSLGLPEVVCALAAIAVAAAAWLLRPRAWVEDDRRDHTDDSSASLPAK